MSDSALPSALIELLERFYGAGAQRDFSKVIGIYVRRPYERLVHRLRKHGEVVETTDPNDDVCFTYTVGSLGVCLSMVGPYTVVTREGDDHGHLVPVLAASNSLERSVLEAITAEGFFLLDPDLMERPVDLWEEDQSATVYSCLFFTGDTVPWTGSVG